MARESSALRSVSILGALAFASSLLAGADAFARRYGWDAGPWTNAAWLPITIDVSLFSAFAMHHSLFARTGLKTVVASAVPPDAERTVYVWIASILFFITCWYWQPVSGTLWRTDGFVAGCLIALQIAGVILTARSAARLGVLELAGVTIVDEHAPARTLIDTGVYAIVRHPIYLAWLLMVWPTPVMTGTRLVFALTSTVYLMLAVPFEERDLRKVFGAAYADYARRVRWRMLPFIY